MCTLHGHKVFSLIFISYQAEKAEKSKIIFNMAVHFCYPNLFFVWWPSQLRPTRLDSVRETLIKKPHNSSGKSRKIATKTPRNSTQQKNQPQNQIEF